MTLLLAFLLLPQLDKDAELRELRHAEEILQHEETLARQRAIQDEVTQRLSEAEDEVLIPGG